DLRVDYTRESLTGTHIHYQQYIDGIPVVGGERIETIANDGKRTVTERLAKASTSRIAALSANVPLAGDLVYLNINGEAKLASRVVVEEQPHRKYANYYDASTGALIRSEPLFWSMQARVFTVNPVAKLNRPDLRDQNDLAAAVPIEAYSIVDVPDLAPGGMLSGPNVKIVDNEQPFTPHADSSLPLLFDRGQTPFEEVNAYYNIDRSARYLQSLGFTGARRIIPYALPVDPHAANGTDNSFFVIDSPGVGVLYFGDGGTDDAEDPDIMLHEFGHAIQESIAPGAFGGTSSSQSRALGEGFGDYWSFSENYEGTVPSGRDPFCIGDWDARCGGDDPSQLCGYPAGADCLRRVDSTKTMADFINSDVAGTEHTNGEIWSSGLREIFMNAGKRTTDTLVLEATYGMPVGATYSLFAQRMLAVDRSLYGGENVPAICAAMTRRAILGSLDCQAMPRGEVTWFQSTTSTLTITDPRTIAGISLHLVPADAQVTLMGPDGTVASVNAFVGKPAAGTWTLISSQPVRWSLAITFSGDVPSQTRPNSSGTAKFIAAVANAPGANGTKFITDVRLFNRSDSAANVTAVFTPTSSDGTANYAAVNIELAPNQLVAINDIVGNMMQTSGTGQLELLGADQVLAMSRTYTQSTAGSFGQFVPTTDSSEAVGVADDPIFVPGLENSAGYRSNIGFAEVSGAPVEVHVRYFDETGPLIGSEVYGLAPFSHSQVHVTPDGEAIRAEVTVVGAGRVVAYGSVVDNQSGDAMFIPAARVRQGYIPAIHAAGANATLWRTDVWISDISGGAVVRRDILGHDGFTFFNFANASKGGTLVTSRTYTTSANGTYGQFVPPGVPSTAPATLIGIENDAAFRTNIGFVSPSASQVRVIAYDASGNEVWRSDVAVQEIAQIPLPVTLPLGRVTVQVLGGAGVVPYASVVDNRSGDPIYIVAQY
ncbi:MAG TPA: hypothetical protein VJ853_12960, partial [Thermoanaerobaculia bacterium]|nr:hypothetical protein [Thermoanaerobaculia bacterium]